MRIRDAPQRGSPGTCANCWLANMAKPPKPRMPMPTAFAAMSALLEFGLRSPYGTLFSRYPLLRVVEEDWQDPIRPIGPVSGSDRARIPPHLALSRSRHTVAGW